MARKSNDSEKGPFLSRRQLLGGAAAGVAAGAVGGFANAAQALSPGVPKRVAQELTADVVVAGAGMGGLTAAVRAQHSGAQRVILLEKAAQPGGTCAHSAGGVANREWDDMRNNNPDGDPVVQRTVYDNIERFFSFMEEINAPITQPVDRMPEEFQAATGERQGRTIAPVVWVRFMAGEFEGNGGTLLTETPLVKLLTNAQNEVIGVLARGPDGPVHIRTKAVILATGGWMHNHQLVNQNITRHHIIQRNVSHWRETPLFTGDGFFAASEVGAAPSKGGWDGFYGHLLPARPGRVMEPMVNVSMYHGQYGVALNMYGRRFTDESAGKWAGRGPEFTRRNEQILNQEVARQPEGSSIYIWDEPINQERACAECALGGVDKWLAYQNAGAPVAHAETVQELADQIEGWGRGISSETVHQQVTEYNEAAAADKAWALPIPKTGAEQGHANPLTTGPFYAILGTAGITATYGGLRADSQGRVLDRLDRPIPGLFAAGIDIGNFSNYAYLGNLILGGSYGFVSGSYAARQPEPAGGWVVAPTGAPSPS